MNTIGITQTIIDTYAENKKKASEANNLNKSKEQKK